MKKCTCLRAPLYNVFRVFVIAIINHLPGIYPVIPTVIYLEKIVTDRAIPEIKMSHFLLDVLFVST